MTFYIFRKILLLTLLTSINLVHATDLIRYVESKKYPDPNQSYFTDLLTLALEASRKEYGDYQLQPVAIEMAQGRTSLMLERNELVDLTWRMTSKTLEKNLQAVYFPILKGLMGYRIFIILKNKQHIFTKETPLQKLQNIALGQGYNWPDTDILLANGFSVAKGYDNHLLDMLKKGRFIFYPRALHEPWPEIINESKLAVEENLMLKYPAPIFFFVNKQNKRLEQRLTLGLTKLLVSGEFEKFFLNHPVTSEILTKAKVDKRTVFVLKNPLLSEQTKTLLEDKRLWIELK